MAESAEADTTQGSLSRADSHNRRNCWVCFASDEDDPTAGWLKPCRCKGSTKWVHESCLQRWVDEKQKGDTFAKVNCAQCGTDYVIIYPPLGILVALLERTDRVLVKFCPVLTGGIILGSIYWTAVTYGAITLMEVMGYSEAMTYFEGAQPALLLVGLPTIPVLLIVAKMIRWEDTVVHILQQLKARARHRRCKFGMDAADGSGGGGDAHIRPPPQQPLIPQPVAQPPVRDQASATRIIVGALALPTVSMACGKWLFSSFAGLTAWQRTLLGGASFLAVKGVLKVYFKYSQQERKSKRRILDFEHHQTASMETQTMDEDGEDWVDEDDDDSVPALVGDQDSIGAPSDGEGGDMS